MKDGSDSMEILITVLATLIFVSHVYLIIIAITSRNVHTQSYNAAVGIANYLNEVGSASAGVGLEQSQAETAKIMAEAKLLEAQANMINSDNKTKMGL